MSLPAGDQRFFSSTRGRIVALLRRASRTVDELAQALELTDNAVRAQLTTLERDGLVRQGTVRRGTSKPASVYELTPAAGRFFPQVYGLVFRQMLDVLAEQLPHERLEEALREVGRRLAGAARGAGDAAGLSLRSRAELGVAALGNLGGLAEIEEGEDVLLIRGYNCPLAAAVPGHPEVCRMAETLLAGVTLASVRERCDRGDPLRCCFEMRLPGSAAS